MLGHRSLKVSESIYARYTRRAENSGIDEFLRKRASEREFDYHMDDLKDLTKKVSLNLSIFQTDS